jgi:hypothetical protein
MTAVKKTIEFTGKDVKTFAGWLRRFASIDNSLLLEIDQVKSIFVAKAYNDERSVVKMSSIGFEQANLESKVSKDTKRIKVGIFNIPRLIKIMDQFNDSEFTITVEYQEIVNENDTQYASEKLLLKNKSLKMNVDCTSLNIFKYIPDDLFNGTIATIDVIGTFELPKVSIEKINSLCALDNEHKFIEFKFKDNEIYVSGKTFELLIGETKSANTTLSVFKEQYATLDLEGYNVKLGEDRLVFKSKDSDTTSVISMTTDTE